MGARIIDAGFRKGGVLTTVIFSVDVPVATSPNRFFTAAVPWIAGDVKISIDGGAVANTTNLPTRIGSTPLYTLQLEAAEMLANQTVDVYLVDQDGPTWGDTLIQLKTTLEASLLDVDGTSALTPGPAVNLIGGANFAGLKSKGGNDAAGLELLGTGVGPGVTSTGGGTGNGLNLAAGPGGALGLSVVAAGGIGAKVQGGSTIGLQVVGFAGPAIQAGSTSGNQDALQLLGVGTGSGAYLKGGASGSHGLLAEGVSGGNGIRALGGGTGFVAVGQGSGAGAQFLGGATAGASGLLIANQNTTGRGIFVTAQGGHALELAGTGSADTVSVTNNSTGGAVTIGAVGLGADAVAISSGRVGLAIVGNTFGARLQAGVGGVGLEVDGGAGGDAVHLIGDEPAAGSGSALVMVGSGAATVVTVAGGVGGIGMSITGDSTQALVLQSTGAGVPLNIVGDTAQAINVVTNGIQAAIEVTNQGVGLGMQLSGGRGLLILTTAGDGVQILPTAGRGVLIQADGNAAGVALEGAGTGPGLLSTGGATGLGGSFVAGASGTAGLSITSSLLNGYGLFVNAASGVGASINGNGVGLEVVSTVATGLRIQGTTGITSTGSLSYGLFVQGGGSNPGVLFSNTGTGHGLSVIAGTGGRGITVAGNGAGAGLALVAGATGVGLLVTAAGGDAAQFTSSGGNGDGIQATGAGTGFGARFVGGNTDQGDIEGILDDSVLNTGLAQAGDATHITLSAAASGINDYYVGALVMIVAGTGVGQAQAITGYVGGTRVAEVPGWITVPDATSQYVVIPGGGGSSGGLTAAQVWAYQEGSEPITAIPNLATMLQIMQHSKRAMFNRNVATNTQLAIYRDDSVTVLERAVRSFDRLQAQRGKFQ